MISLTAVPVSNSRVLPLMGGMLVTLQALSSSTALGPRLLPPGSSNVFSLLGWRRRRSCANSLSSRSAAAFTTINVTKRPRCFHSPSVYSILAWKWTLWKFWVCEEPRRYFHLKCHGSNNTLCLQFAVHLVTLNCFAAAAEWDAEVVAAVPRTCEGPNRDAQEGFTRGKMRVSTMKKTHTMCTNVVQHEGKDSLQLLSDTYSDCRHTQIAAIHLCNLCVQSLTAQIQQNILLHRPKCHYHHLQSHILAHCPSNANATPHQSNVQGDLQNVYKLCVTPLAWTVEFLGCLLALCTGLVLTICIEEP